MCVAGNSGLVYRAYLVTDAGKKLVAVKTLKGEVIVQHNLHSAGHHHNLFKTAEILNLRFHQIYRVAYILFSNRILLLSALFSNADMEHLEKEVSTMLSLMSCLWWECV